jgi:hypothetical protein
LNSVRAKRLFNRARSISKNARKEKTERVERRKMKIQKKDKFNGISAAVETKQKLNNRRRRKIR